MGYEVTMLVASRSSLRHDVALVGNRVVNVHEEKMGEKSVLMYFDEAGENESVLPVDAPVKRAASWFQPIAVVELCKADLNMASVCAFEKSAGEHMYPPFEGNELLGLDSYGEYRRAVPAAEVAEELKKRVAVKEPYRRYSAALALLTSVLEGFPGHEVFCFFYGH